MSQRLRKNSDFLKVLARASPKQCRGIIDGANSDLIYTMCECASNCLKGNVPLSPSQKRKLAIHKHSLRSLVSKSTSLKKKRKILQKGGFLGVLLKPIIQTLGSILLQ